MCGAVFPTAVFASTATSNATLSKMVGQMVMVGFRGTGLENELGSSEANSLPVLREEIKAGKVGGVIYFDKDVKRKEAVRNIVSLEQIEKMSADLQILAPVKLFISIDQEGGKVARIKPEHGMPAFASHQELGGQPLVDVSKSAFEMAQYLAGVGINLNFAPDVDVNINPANPVIGSIERSFSNDENTVVVYAQAFAESQWKNKLISCYKHFPGHGSSDEDTHLGIADVTATWQERELTPYREILKKTPPAMVMVGHVVNQKLDSSLPASLSRPVITGLLREKLGWQGVVITDDLQMRAIADSYGLEETVRLAVEAGVDILLFGNNLDFDPHMGGKVHDLLIGLVEKGVISHERIESSYTRIMALKKQLP